MNDEIKNFINKFQNNIFDNILTKEKENEEIIKIIEKIKEKTTYSCRMEILLYFENENIFELVKNKLEDILQKKMSDNNKEINNFISSNLFKEV